MDSHTTKETDRLHIRRSLGTRFSLHIFLVLIIVNFFSLFYIYTKEEARNLRDLREQGRVIGKYIATSVSSQLINYDFIALETALQEAMQLKGLSYTAILASNEIYVAARVAPGHLHTDVTHSSTTVPGPQEQIKCVRTLRAEPRDHIDVSTPIIFADNYLGRVVVGLSMDISRKKTTDFLSILLLVNGVVALLLAGGIYFFFWRKTLQPIYHLIDGAERVAQGNYDEAVPLASRDEIGLLTDSFNAMMTARKKAEEETRKSRRDWERLFNAVDDVVTIQDTSMRIIQANQATGRLLGKDPSELIGKHCYEIFRDRNTACPECPAPLCLQEHQNRHGDIDYPELGKTFHISAFPIYDPDQGWIGIAHIARDITEQKKLEAQYRQAQKMEAIGTLAGGIAHDFNNILTPIFGYAQLIKLEAEPGSTLETNVDRILHSSQMAKQLVKQIMTFSRERQHQLEPVTVEPLIMESMKLLRASIPSTIEFKVEIAKDCGNILADPTQVHQVIMNICTNAFHAMEQSGGVLALSASRVNLDSLTAHLKGNLEAGDYIRLQISDSGIGMDRSTRERIFEPFFTTKQENKGTGMGLAVVHGIIKEHNGAIFVYSEPGKGTTFTIYLPRVSPAAETKSVIREKEAALSFPCGNEHIMVVDDEDYIVGLEQRILEEAGYRVSSFTSCAEALETFRSDPQQFDLVITDMTMPRISGVELAEQLKAMRTDIPVILCTGHSRISLDDLQQSKAITSFLAKPINIGQLTRQVRKALDGQEPGNALTEEG